MLFTQFAAGNALSALQQRDGLCETPSWLTVDWLLAAFGARRGNTALCGFRGGGGNQPAPWENLKSQIFLGSEDFVATLQLALNSGPFLREIPSVQRRPPPKPLTEIAREHDRDSAIFHAYASGGYSMREIGDCDVCTLLIDRRF